MPGASWRTEHLLPREETTGEFHASRSTFRPLARPSSVTDLENDNPCYLASLFAELRNVRDIEHTILKRSHLS